MIFCAKVMFYSCSQPSIPIILIVFYTYFSWKNQDYFIIIGLSPLAFAFTLQTLSVLIKRQVYIGYWLSNKKRAIYLHRSEPKIRRLTIGRKQFLFLFPAGTEGATRGVIPLPQWSYPPIFNTGAQLLFRILPQIFFFLSGVVSKSKVVPTSKKFFHVFFAQKTDN